MSSSERLQHDLSSSTSKANRGSSRQRLRVMCNVMSKKTRDLHIPLVSKRPKGRGTQQHTSLESSEVERKHKLNVPLSTMSPIVPNGTRTAAGRRNFGTAVDQSKTAVNVARCRKRHLHKGKVSNGGSCPALVHMSVPHKLHPTPPA